MNEAELLKLEGRLNGLREVVEALARELSDDACRRLAIALQDRLVPPDHQEDPGAVPQLALVVEAAATGEIRQFLVGLAARRPELQPFLRPGTIADLSGSGAPEKEAGNE